MKNRLLILFLALFSSTQLYSQKLSDLLEKLVANNSELKAVNNQFLAAKERIQQESQLSNPTIGVGVPVLRPETRLGPQITMVSATQMFPWFGTFKTREAVMIQMSEAKYYEVALLKLDLVYQLKEAYYRLVFNFQKTELLKENKELYESLEQIALSKVESGSGTTANVYRVQLRKQKIDQEIAEINFQNQQLSVIINQLIKAPLQNVIIPSGEKDDLEIVEFDTTKFRSNLRKHPKMAQLTHQIEASSNRQLLSQKMNSPMLGIGIDYSLVGERLDANPTYNGRDILIPKVMLTIPLYQKKNKSIQTEETLIQEGIGFQKTALEDEIMRQLLNLKTDYDKFLSQITFYKKQNETTKLAVEVLLSNYSVSGSGFDEILELYNDLLQNEIKIENAQLQSKLVFAKIEKLTAY